MLNCCLLLLGQKEGFDPEKWQKAKICSGLLRQLSFLRASRFTGMPCIRQHLLHLAGIGTLLPTTPINFVAEKRRKVL
jgi:hypothetical protein